MASSWATALDKNSFSYLPGGIIPQPAHHGGRKAAFVTVAETSPGNTAENVIS
jgi:hypothetical protein